jgi:hypothetical protein
MFERATKMKLRFDSPMGQLTTEDLWDLPLTGRKFSLDDLAKNLNRQIKEAEEESFVVKRTYANQTLNLKFDIVKHVIQVKMDEAEVKDQAAKKKAEKARIMEIISQKENEALQSKSLDELKALLNG